MGNLTRHVNNTRACNYCGETKLAGLFLPRAKRLKRVVICMACVKLLNKQANSVCLLCGRVDKRMCIDHDHKTGRVRGLICYGCNLGIANFHEDPDVLQRVVWYLKGELYDS